MKTALISVRLDCRVTGVVGLDDAQQPVGGLSTDLIAVLAGKQRVERHVPINESDPYYTELRKSVARPLSRRFDATFPIAPGCNAQMPVLPNAALTGESI